MRGGQRVLGRLPRASACGGLVQRADTPPTLRATRHRQKADTYDETAAIGNQADPRLGVVLGPHLVRHLALPAAVRAGAVKASGVFRLAAPQPIL